MVTRKHTSPLKRLLIVLALSSLATPVFAQESETSGQLEQSSQTSDKEKRDFVSTSITEMQDAVRNISRKLEQAEKEKDELKIQCLSKKLAAVRSLSEVSEDAQTAMERALNNGEQNLAEHEFRKVAVALSKVRQFMAEAEACSGDTDTTPGVTDVYVSVDELAEETTEEEIDDGSFDVGTDPPDTSPFQ